MAEANVRRRGTGSPEPPERIRTTREPPNPSPMSTPNRSPQSSVPLERIDDCTWRIPKSTRPGMLVDGLIFADDNLIDLVRSDRAADQVANVAHLPGIQTASLAMPDIHWGYGFPIGGVAAMRADEGVVSPGGVGFDINCGVRLAVTGLDDVEVRPAPVRVGDPTAQPYDLTDAWRYRVTFSRVAPAADGQPAEGPFDVLVRAVPEHGPASALAPAQRATLGPGATAEIELRLPFAEGEPAFAVEVTDAATGEVLGGSALVRQLGDPWDVRYPYKNALFHTTGLRWPVVVHVRRTPRAVVSRLRATATLRDGRGRVVRSVESAFARDGLRLPLTGSDLACGAYELTVVVSDETGRPLRRETRPLRVLPTAPHEVALTPEGDLLVDGEAFFPIGLYWVFANPDDWKPGPARKDAEFLELRRAGFNTLHSYAFEHNDANDTDENALAYLDTAQEFGFKVMMGLRRDWYQGEAVDLGAIERRVLALKDHPSLLCWTLWDEPNFDPDFSAPRVRAMYDLLDRLDPYHPAMPVFGGPDAGAFRDCADVFLFDHYPGRGGGASVARAMDRARESLPEKPIWFVAQAFRSGGQLPTEEDMGLFWRNALERGARAVFWYSYGGGAYQWDSVRTDPAHWEAVKRVVSELARATSPASRFE